MYAKTLMYSAGVRATLVLALVSLAALPVQAATASELLEKAIYAEETAGDLDGAIKLYEQVIAEARAAQSEAAKAQYRLGLIFEKQGKIEQATAAFRSVIANYPNETALVAEARKRLPSELTLLPAPWVDGEEMQLDMSLATGLDVGTMIYRIAATKHEDRDAWQCSTLGLVTANDSRSSSRVLCGAEAFAPINSFWMHSLLGQAEATYTDDSVQITVAGKEAPVVIKVSPPVFDNEQSMQLFRRLPLVVGYKTTLNVVSSLGSGEIKLALEVPEMETITTPAGTFECYKLVLNIGQTFWITNDEHRYVARFSAGGVTANLSRIEQRAVDATTKLQGPGFTAELPGGWRAYSPAPRKSGEAATFLLDGAARVQAMISSEPVASLKEAERKSSSAWVDSGVAELTKLLKGFKPRAPGVQELKIGSRIGATVLADYGDGDKPMVFYGVAVLGDTRAVNLQVRIAASDFDALKPQLESIATSLTVE